MIRARLGLAALVLLGACDGETNRPPPPPPVPDSGPRADTGVMDMDAMVLPDGALPDGALPDGATGMDGATPMDGATTGDGATMDAATLPDGAPIDASDPTDSGPFDPGDSSIDFCSMVTPGTPCASGVDCAADEACIANGCGQMRCYPAGRGCADDEKARRQLRH